MDLLIVAAVALAASTLTFFSGFGLGTLLLPVFAVFFPLEGAVAVTAVVHLANNLFKVWLVGRKADARTVVRFGLPAIPAALVGAALLHALAGKGELHTYTIGGHPARVTATGVVIATLIAGFAVLELVPAFHRLAFHPRWLPLGGVLSGFLGGLSGHQGALRSAFLVRAGLGKDAFIATGVACSLMVDVSRLAVYAGPGGGAWSDAVARGWLFPLTASLAAVVGSLLGQRMLKTVTLTGVRRTLGVTLVLFAVALGAGIV